MDKPILDYSTPAPPRVTSPHDAGHAIRTWSVILSYLVFPAAPWLLNWEAPNLPMIVGIGGVLLIAASDFVRHRAVLLVGLLALACSFGLCLLASGSYWLVVLALSTPFLAMYVVKGAIDLLQLGKDALPESSARPAEIASAQRTDHDPLR